MKNEILLSAIVSGIVSLIVSLIVDFQKWKREEKIERRNTKREEYQNRPQMTITDYKNYISRIGYGLKQKCDIELFAIPIEDVMCKESNIDFYVKYNDEYLNTHQWCCVIYLFKNTGKTDISMIDIIWNSKKNSCLFPKDLAVQFVESGSLNYSCPLDKKISVGEAFSLKVVFHKDAMLGGGLYAVASIIMIDVNDNLWIQPLFVPENKTYCSKTISEAQYIKSREVDEAIKCFKNPFLW